MVAEGPGPCAGARASARAGEGGRAWRFVEIVADRLVFEGRLFPAPAGEEAKSQEQEVLEADLLADTDAAYEACPAALLLALAAHAARQLVNGDMQQSLIFQSEFASWNSLSWTAPLAWHNLQDPVVRGALLAQDLTFKVIQELVSRPEHLCGLFQDRLTWLYVDAAGLSLTVSHNGTANLANYGHLAHMASAIASHDHLLRAAPGCEPAVLLGHVFAARRVLDLRMSLGKTHVWAADKLVPLSKLGSTWAGLLDRLWAGLELHTQWLKDTLMGNSPALSAEAPRAGNGAGGPFAIWEQGLTPVFSEANKDPILERLFKMIGAKTREYVEIGTQLGDQCNSRYLRVRYGFAGLMLDDNFQNPEINQRRHVVTPGNVVGLFRQYGVPEELDLLSIDTDGYEWLLWLTLRQGRFSPRVVVIEFGGKLPYNWDVFVRYTPFPVHRMCLANLQRFPWLGGGSLTGLLRMGRSWGYALVHVVAGGTTDLIFVRRDVLQDKGLTFPAQDDPAGLCALARFQTEGLGAPCLKAWPAGRAAPPSELLTTSGAALAGDYRVPEGWTAQRLRDAMC